MHQSLVYKRRKLVRAILKPLDCDARPTERLYMLGRDPFAEAIDCQLLALLRS